VLLWRRAPLPPAPSLPGSAPGAPAADRASVSFSVSVQASPGVAASCRALRATPAPRGEPPCAPLQRPSALVTGSLARPALPGHALGFGAGLPAASLPPPSPSPSQQRREKRTRVRRFLPDCEAHSHSPEVSNGSSAVFAWVTTVQGPGGRRMNCTTCAALCQVDSQPAVSCSGGVFVANGLPNGNHTFGVQASAPNASNAEAQFSWLVGECSQEKGRGHCPLPLPSSWSPFASATCPALSLRP